MTTKQHCPVQRWTWKSIPKLYTNPQLPNQVSPLHNHYVPALYTIIISHICPAAPLTAKIISHPQHASTSWNVSKFSVFKIAAMSNSTFFRQKRDTSVRYTSPFLDGPQTNMGGISSAHQQLGGKPLLESTLGSTPECKPCSGKSLSPAAWTWWAAGTKGCLKDSPVCRRCCMMVPTR